MHPQLGVWRSSDHALSRNGPNVDDDWCKQVVLFARDGYMVLGYSGLGQSPSGRSIAEFVSAAYAPKAMTRFNSRSGQWNYTSHDTSMQDYCERITKTFNNPMYNWTNSLRLSGGGFVNGEMRYLAITNRLDDGGLGSLGNFRWFYGGASHWTAAQYFLKALERRH